MSLVTEFTIDVDRWLCGEGAGNSSLFREFDSKQCCVGQWLSACGYSDETLRGNTAAANVSDCQLPGMETMDLSWNNWVNLYAVNDHARTPDPERRDLIREGFVEHGITVHFSDEVSP